MYNFIKQADGSYSDVGSIGAKVVDDTEDFGISATAPPSVVCSDYTTESTCTAAGCYWRDGACYSTPTPEPGIPWVYILAVGGIAAIIGAMVLIKR